MIQVTVVLASRYKGVIGKDTVQLELPEGSTVEKAISELANTYGEEISQMTMDKKTGRPTVVSIVNHKKSIIDTVLDDGDTVTLLPPIAGG